jgi:hypothetical protein
MIDPDAIHGASAVLRAYPEVARLFACPERDIGIQRADT